jgi:glycosyltransferase involved in cell wall biosynthesis/Flp pilus assembly protein TadD
MRPALCAADVAHNNLYEAKLMNTDSKSTNPIPSISACLIVRNEEKLLEKCLNSIRDYVDEIIIVDTGSTDRTVEIAESFGARIYHHPWEDHFSRHRNQSFGYAKYDWILYIDADEELLPGSGEVLRKSITDADDDVHAIAVILECIFNGGKSMAYNNAVRLFRNHRGFYYKGRVHNYIVGVKNVLCCPIRLFHYGYNLDRSTMSRKFERTTKLLKLDIADDPNDPRPHHFLSASYLSENMYEEALEEAGASVLLCESHNSISHNYFWSLYIAATSSLNLGRREEARAFAEKGIHLFYDHLDSHYILSLLAHEGRDRLLFEKHFKNYLRIKETYQANPEKFGEMVHNTIGSQWFLHLLYALLLLDENMNEEAGSHIETARLQCPDPYLLEIRLGNYYLNHERYKGAESCFHKLLEIRPDDPALKKSLALICGKTGKYEEQITLIEEILKTDDADLDLYFSLGLSRMRMGDYDKAESAFTRIIVADSNNIRALINKAICLNELERFKEVKPLLGDLKCEDHVLKRLILSNLAFSLFSSGNRNEATEVLHALEQLDPDGFYPPVFLSRICLEQNDIEACIRHCNKLITLLGIKTDKTLNSIEDLACYYISAARSFIKVPDSVRFTKECLEVALALSNNNPSLLTDIGVLFIQIGLIRIGMQILKSALLLSSQDEKVRKKITEIIKSQTSIINTAHGSGPTPL